MLLAWSDTGTLKRLPALSHFPLFFCLQEQKETTAVQEMKLKVPVDFEIAMLDVLSG